MRKKIYGGNGELAPGFTLLEVLVALSIMGMAIALILQLYSSNLRSLTATGDMISATAGANVRLREILADPALRERSWNETGEQSWPMEISVVEVMPERTLNLPVKLMEVTLTVHWKGGLKGKKLTFKTMKVIDRNA